MKVLVPLSSCESIPVFCVQSKCALDVLVNSPTRLFVIAHNRTPPTIHDIAKELQHVQAFASPDTTDTSDDDSGEETDSDTSNPLPSEPGMIWREEKGKSVYVQKFYAPRGTQNKSFRKDLTMEEVSKHNTVEDCWVVIESHVYDISKFVPLHPGGWLNLENMAGKDCTDAFANYHPATVYRTLLPAFYVGDVVDTLDDDPFTIEHRSIRQDLLRRGLFETNYYFYFLKVLLLSVLLSVGLWMTLSGTTTARRMSGAVVMVSKRFHVQRLYSQSKWLSLTSFSVARLLSGINWPSLDMTSDTTPSHTPQKTTYSLASFLATPWAELDLDGGSILTMYTTLYATVYSMTLISSTCHSLLSPMTCLMRESSRRAAATTKRITASGRVSTESGFRPIFSLTSLSAISTISFTLSWLSRGSIFTSKAGFS